MQRKNKRSGRFRGYPHHGTGGTKNKRGKGCKGGWGRAGSRKHRWTYVTKYEKDFAKYGGHRGFHNPASKKVATINIFKIQNMADAGKLKKENGKYVFEFDGKILGTGELTHPIIVRARAATERAVARIKAKGGNFEQVGKAKEQNSS